MLRGGFLLLCTLVVSLLVATTLHAMDLPGSMVVDQCGYSDEAAAEAAPADEAPGNVTEGLPDHHGCVSESGFMAAAFGQACEAVRAPNLHGCRSASVLARLQPDPDLRPPIA